MSLASLQPVLRSGSSSSAPLVSVDCTSHHLASSASYSLAHGVAEASFSLQAETGYIMKLSSQLGITMVASKGRGYGEAAFRTYEKYATCPFPRRKNKRCVRMNAEGENAGVSGETSETRVRSTVEQSKRILAMQKELLEQIEERKRLVTELKENLGNQVGKIQAYNVDDTSKRDKSRERLPVALETQIQSSFGEQEISEPTSSANIQESTRRSFGIMWPPNASDKSSTRQQNTVAESKPQSPLPSVQEHSPSSTLTSSSVVSFPAPGIWKRSDKAKESVLAVEDTEESPESELLEEVKKDAAAGTDEEKPPPLAGLNVMNVVIVAAECAPWSKTGGLGDVAGALPKALARRGHRVMVVAPRYGNYLEAWETGVRKTYNVAGQDMTVGYFHGYIDGVDYVFVDNTMFHGFANNIYGGSREDVLKRMILFCKAAVEVPWHVPCGGVCYGDGNLVFIANDWHTALLPVYLQAYYRDHGLMAYTRCVLVIHNMAHQGRGPLSDFQLLGLPDHYLDKFRLYDPIGGEHNNIFMAGLITAHRIVTVSHGYAWECQTQLGGWGLDGVIRKYNWKLRGIVNGIDDEEWNPELDKFLQSDGYTNYSIDTLEIGKGACKAALQKELGLPVRISVPVLGFIGRLDPQKGVDIIAEAMHWMTGQDLQLVMLGSGRADLENMLRSFEGKHRDKVRGWVGFSVKTSHRITAGADILLMPSRFEPCGLNQLYAMRYGTIPVVHAVGGLRDTVKGFDPYSNTGTGWTFDRADPSALIHALGNALWTYRDFKESWLGIQKRGMSQDLSWDNAAKQYEEEIVKAKYQW